MLPWMSSSPCFEVTLPGGKQPVHALPSASPAVRPSAVRSVFRGPFQPVNKKRGCSQQNTIPFCPRFILGDFNV